MLKAYWRWHVSSPDIRSSSVRPPLLRFQAALTTHVHHACRPRIESRARGFPRFDRPWLSLPQPNGNQDVADGDVEDVVFNVDVMANGLAELSDIEANLNVTIFLGPDVNKFIVPVTV